MKVKFEIQSRFNQFPGLGDGFIEMINGKDGDPQITVSFPKHNITIITATGEEARKLIHEFNPEDFTREDLLERVLNAACTTVSIDRARLMYKKNEYSRIIKESEPKFARWLVYWFLIERMNYTLEKAGKVFQQDHATVLNAVKLINGSNLLDYEIVWRKKFFALVKNF